MRNSGLAFLSLLIAAALTLACGTSPPHLLQSVSINPSTATANGSSVQFSWRRVCTTPTHPL